MTALPYICNSTTIYQLMQAGIVPEWMYRDCDIHGMDTAEDFLCEWDWDWSWDLGYGYTDSQLAILKEARETVRLGIEEFERNPELQIIEQDRVDRIKKKRELSETLKKKLCPPLYVAEIPDIVKYVLQHNEEPVFSIFYCWFVRYGHSDRNKVRFIMAGIFDGISRTPGEIAEMTKTGELKEKFGIETEFTLKQLQRLAKTPYEIKGKFDYLIPAVMSKLEQYQQNEQESDATMQVFSIPSESSLVWQEIMEREPFRFKPQLMSRALAYFLK
ncbi:MAG: hypothetical protein K2N25_09415 [Muribaculaceae bacterium]|nr:hypothetical protein [Muribaculaceae bacterium]